MEKTKTFQNLLILESARDTAKQFFKDKYYEAVKPMVSVIEITMKANNENHFEAAKRIQDKTNLVDAEYNKILLAAALMELVEEINLSELKIR